MQKIAGTKLIQFFIYANKKITLELTNPDFINR